MRAVILAAGFGTRLHPLTKDRPKALLDLAGKPVIDHVLERVLEADAIRGEIVVVTNARFEAAFRDWAAGNAAIRIVANDVTEASRRRGAVADLRLALDSRRALHPAGEADDEDRGYVVIAADNVFGFPLDGMVGVLRDREEAGAVVAVHDPEPLRELRGRSVACVDDEGWVTRMQEKAREPDCPRRVAAIYAFGPGLPRWIDGFLEGGGDPDSPGYLLQWLVGRPSAGQGLAGSERTDMDVRVAAHPVSGYRFDVGTPDRLREARAFFEGAKGG